METTTLQAEVREERGKGSARRLRNQGKLPAVLYGPGIESTPLTVPPKDLTKALRSEHGRNVVYTLEFGGKTELAMVKDLAVEPVGGALLHADFLRVTEDMELEVNVPFRAEGRAQGVRMGGMLNVTTRTVPIRTTVTNIPVAVVVDVTDLELHETVTIKDLVLPEGCVAMMRAEHTLAIVLESKKMMSDEDGEEDEAGEAAVPDA